MKPERSHENILSLIASFEQEHIPQLLVLFGLRPDVDYNRVNPMS